MSTQEKENISEQYKPKINNSNIHNNNKLLKTISKPMSNQINQIVEYQYDNIDNQNENENDVNIQTEENNDNSSETRSLYGNNLQEETGNETSQTYNNNFEWIVNKLFQRIDNGSLSLKKFDTQTGQMFFYKNTK